VHVQVAAQVVLLDQLRQPPGARQLDLAPGLAQLGRDPVEAERAVDLLFRTARNDPGAAGDDGAGLPVAAALARQAVLVERQAPGRLATRRSSMLWALLPVK
jgi:hypothetical protein